MTNELQPQLKLLAEKAGVDKPMTQKWRPGYAGGNYLEPIGADGTLTNDECWTVLGWLAKAGYHYSGCQHKGASQLTIHTGTGPNYKPYKGEGDTLNEALVAAVLALSLG